ncbi:MAG: DUF4124 domain-containing protein [Betaproteobacteria bacterium]|nr:DUF4124 domain-containing protein [Betaproteobacteria bacterium]
MAARTAGAPRRESRAKARRAFGAGGLAIAGLLLVASLAQAGTVYRWVDKAGRVHYSDQPPTAEVRSIQEKRLGAANEVETSGPGYALRRAAEAYPVTLWIAHDCQQECRTARDFLKRRGVPFSETVVTSAEDTERFKREFERAEVFVPAVTVGRRKMAGFAEPSWAGMLDDAGYPRTAVPARGRTVPDAAPVPAPAPPPPGANPDAQRR